jgi:hypothetical protein
VRNVFDARCVACREQRVGAIQKKNNLLYTDPLLPTKIVNVAIPFHHCFICDKITNRNKPKVLHLRSKFISLKPGKIHSVLLQTIFRSQEAVV